MSDELRSQAFIIAFCALNLSLTYKKNYIVEFILIC